jgi:hypothetical protein
VNRLHDGRGRLFTSQPEAVEQPSLFGVREGVEVMKRDGAFAHLDTITDDQFAAAGAAADLNAVAARLRDQAGGPVPRWWVLSRVSALRKAGRDMNPFPASQMNDAAAGG